MSLLSVSGLHVRFADEVEALRGVSFDVDRGEALAIVGESGAGKSTLALSLAGFLQPPEAHGSVRLDGVELMGASAQDVRALRWRTVAIALQSVPFNPVLRVGAQIAEPLREHLGMPAAEARRRAEALARDVLLPTALLHRYPHQISGGERRRAALAMVLALDPALVVLDEPTAGIDPPARRELCERIRELREERGFALIAVTHDLSDAARLADRCMVLYAGEAMEAGYTQAVLEDPTHPYTWALVNAYPVMSTTKDLRPIRGLPPDPRSVPPGCPFHPRCTQAQSVCETERVELAPARGRLVACHLGGLRVLLSARSLCKAFDGNRALDGVSLEVREGEAVGVIGPSGSGKTTLARILSGHLSADAGEIDLEGAALPRSWRRADRAMRRRIQLVMQDPWDALSPRMTVAQLLREPLDVDPTAPQDAESATLEALERVGLPSSGSFLRATARDLSGGQLQRIALTRALMTQPKVLVADEPTAMLDASEQARLLVMLRELQVEMGLALVLVSHDVAAVRKVTDRIIVLDRGRVVEEGPSGRVSSSPRATTTRRLVGSASSIEAITGG